MTLDKLDQHDEFMKLFLRSERAVLRYVMCLVPNSHDAREIVQNTAVALWKKFDQYDPAEPFTPWACRFALIEAKQFLKTEHRWHKFLDDETVKQLLSQREKMTEELDERRIHLRNCFGNLTRKQRETVEWYYFHDHSVEQIATANRRSIDAVYKTLQRIRADLKRCVDRNMQMMEQA
ncbi:sigma-70 family RNA polymerase sigma factor [Stieleria sp. ICT_E10.1]|uniref:sigma-70 family RNA polymerase sigma factor n=1 Tax=Stieleria sedimenti TaxID=2976331 RepID=UPI002180506A|nr:sigma-70 family RNA polymerase sigma factor [Stieleria sedimenti]MCS7467633.1 sigma-70 family RNA polymerase sigma factor [Stieleria sedimenti]